VATTTAPPRTEPSRPAPGAHVGEAGASFLGWGLAAYLAVTAAAVAAIVWWLDGHFVYVLDDPAIHLSMADRIAHDGTWGVVPGEFQSASSAPLWTALVAGGLVVAGSAAEWVPLVLNVAAGVAAVWVLAQVPTTVNPGRRRPVDTAAVVVLVTVVLFLPGLAVVGMEHSLHVALVLAAVLAVHRWVLGDTGRGPGPAATYAVVVLATLTRFETAFVAAGLAVALVTVDRRHGRRAVGILASAGLPIVAFAVVNRAMGGGWLPNSVMAKGQFTGASSDSTGPIDIANRLTDDPVLAVLVAGAVAHLALAGLRSRAAVPALTLAVAAPLHAALADIGWYARYQSYLVAIGVYLALVLVAEVPSALHRRAVAVLCAVGVVLAADKANLLVQAPRAADDMYRQQYQAGLFLDRYYDGQAVATDQLGYISWFHEGPLTDFAGLGDYAVLRASDTSDDLWSALTAERGFRVVVLYDKTAAFNVPRGWVLAGEWRIDGTPLSGVSRNLQFFATTTDEVEPLQDHLRDFEDDLPARTRLDINENAALQVMALDME
jgi:hypothetical protein